MLRAQLLEKGVPDSAIEVIPNEVDAIVAALQSGRKGDLIVIFGDNIERCWEQIIGHQVEGGAEAETEAVIPSQSFVEVDPEAFQLDSTAELVRDERGVRIARDEEAD